MTSLGRISVPLGWARALLALSILASATLLVFPSGTLQGDGGTLRVANVPMGAYRVNVFTDPTPITPDTIDVSTLVTFERGRGIATGLEILVLARRVDGAGEELRQAATRQQATDPRYYAANFALDSVGEWEITVQVRGAEGEGETSFRVMVQEPSPLGNPFLILVLALVPLLFVGLWLKKAGRSGGAGPGSPAASGNAAETEPPGGS